jgi:hypothetical protein
LRVVAFESRQSGETLKLIEKSGGVGIAAPSVRELPIEANDAAFAFAERLLTGAYDIVLFMTGVGTRYLFEAMETRHEHAALVAALARTTVVARGPCQYAAAARAQRSDRDHDPRPNTWRESSPHRQGRGHGDLRRANRAGYGVRAIIVPEPRRAVRHRAGAGGRWDCPRTRARYARRRSMLHGRSTSRCSRARARSTVLDFARNSPEASCARRWARS